MSSLHNSQDLQHKHTNAAENSDQNDHNLKLRNRTALYY
jgi:hypothetical protein